MNDDIKKLHEEKRQESGLLKVLQESESQIRDILHDNDTRVSLLVIKPHGDKGEYELIVTKEMPDALFNSAMAAYMANNPKTMQMLKRLILDEASSHVTGGFTA